MSTTMTHVRDIPKVSHDEAMRMAAFEYERMTKLLRDLSDEEWDHPTDCERWTVKSIISHIVGISEGAMRPREMMRQSRKGKPLQKEPGLSRFDAQNEVQVNERAHLGPAEVRAQYEALVPRMLLYRRRLPGVVRALVHIPGGVPGMGWMSLGYLNDIVLTRDIWMHRVDISRATGRQLVLTPEHDGRFVAKVVADWARKHGKAFTLQLEGPAGGTYTQGTGGEGHRLDAVEFCRTLSGRADGPGLLRTQIFF